MGESGVDIELGVLQGTARNMLLAYAVLMDAEYEASAHSRLVVSHLEALERGDIRNLIVMEPPRHGKSYHASERFPAWYLGRHPGNRVILASYAATLAESNSRTVRNLLDDERNPFPVSLQPDSRAVGRWMTQQGGSLLAAGVGGGITGFGGHLLVADDLFAGRQEADSEVIRDRTWLWYQEVFRTRRMSGARELQIGTHWHEDDVQGRILNSRGARNWTVLSIPAIAEEGDVLGRAPGEPLWPSRFVTREQWERLPAAEQERVEPLPSVADGEISARGFAALYQQRPTPSEGGMFKLGWMQRRYSQAQLVELQHGPRWRVVQFVDTATREGVGADFSVIATWGYDGISAYLLDVWRRRVDYPELKMAVQTQYWKWKPRIIGVEDTTHGRPLVQEMKYTTVLPVVAKTVQGTKETRADAVTPLFESGKVVLPDWSPDWLDEWIGEHIAFPNGSHDDQVDTTSGALTELVEPGLHLPRFSLAGKRLARSAV